MENEGLKASNISCSHFGHFKSGMKFILFTIFCVLTSISANSIGPVVMITGANRGLGKAILELLVEDKSVKVIFATYREGSDHTRLEELVNTYKNNKHKFVGKVNMEMSDEKSMKKGLEEMRETIKNLVTERKGKLIGKEMINTLIHNAGIMDSAIGKVDENGKITGEGAQKGVHPLGVDQGYEAFLKHFIVNTAAPAFITSNLKDLLDQSIATPRVVFISSTISLLELFGGTRQVQNVAYPMSKSALNAYMLYLSDIKTPKQGETEKEKFQKLYVAYPENKSNDMTNEWITFSLCPGWVETDMGNLALTKDSANSKIKIQKENVAAKRVLHAIRTKTRKDSGNFYSLATESEKAEAWEVVWRKDLKNEHIHLRSKL